MLESVAYPQIQYAVINTMEKEKVNDEFFG